MGDKKNQKFKKGDKVKFYHQKFKQVMEGVFEGFNTIPTLNGEKTYPLVRTYYSGMKDSILVMVAEKNIISSCN